MSLPQHPASLPARPKEARDLRRSISDVWQWLGLSGDALGTSGTLRKTFFYTYAVAVIVTAAIDIINVITIRHNTPQWGLAQPLIGEMSSWLSFSLFFPIAWIAWRLAPLDVRPRWRLAVHIPCAVILSLAHVAGFIVLRKLTYWSLGAHYEFGAFGSHFPYELRKDAFGYVLFVAGCALTQHLLRQQQLIETPGQSLTFDIRDGARLTRVALRDILAITAAGNYVEFILKDGRRLLLRKSLSAVENDLARRGFVRTHRSWLVNAAWVTGLAPEGSGDYEITLGALTAPLSRRFPGALTELRAGK